MGLTDLFGYRVAVEGGLLWTPPWMTEKLWNSEQLTFKNWIFKTLQEMNEEDAPIPLTTSFGVLG